MDEGIADRLDQLTGALEEQSRLRAKDQELAERLHEENARLRVGEVREIQRPLVSNVATLLDAVTKAAGEDPEEASKLDFVREGLLEVLASAGLTELPAEEGEPFERGLHKAVEKVAADDQSRNGQIAEVKRTGFVWADERVLRPAEVAVFVFTPVEEAPLE